MRNLNVNEIEKVSGGVIPIGVALALHFAGNAASVYGWYSFAKSMRKQEVHDMKELSTKEINAVNGGFWGWLSTRAIGAYNTFGSLNWSGSSHNSNFRRAATNRL